ncbi:MAG TPA: thrombospondin type 3 repeat-containing protein [Polyangiaceae bacterium]|jgi:hypothetical protein
MTARILFLLALSALVISSRAAHASPNYPDAVLKYIGGKPPAPPCTLCHSSDLGGPGTVVTDFGREVLSQGAIGKNDVGSLDRALATMDAEQTDSDGDGIPDLDELRMGSDPNDGPGNGLPIPQTGCAVRGSPDSGVVTLLALALCSIALRVRSRRKT